MGLEQKWFLEEPLIVINKESPSHAVGLELYLGEHELVDVVDCLSPSHTVGLELPTVEGAHPLSRRSPSHTVGLEQKFIKQSLSLKQKVTIPRGGLGTLALPCKPSQPARS